MSVYIPISGAANKFIKDLEKVKNHITVDSENVLKAVNDGKINLPETLNDLDKETVNVVNLSVDAALSLNISFGSTDNKVSRRVFIQEYKKYKEITHGDETLHYGIGLRWILNIQKINSDADISSLPMVAASAQFNNISASVRFEVVGFTSKAITDLLPTNAELNADTYVDLKNAFEAIKDKIWHKETIINPTTLGIQGSLHSDEEKIYREAAAIAYALKKIKAGRTLNNALNSIKMNPQSTKDIVSSVYQDILASTSLTAAPNPGHKQKAKDILAGML